MGLFEDLHALVVAEQAKAVALASLADSVKKFVDAALADHGPLTEVKVELGQPTTHAPSK